MTSSASARLRPRVLLVIHNPVVRAGGPAGAGWRLHQVLGWNNPDDLTYRYIEDVAEVSAGRVQYDVVDRVEVNGFPVKEDGFVYTAESYLAAWRDRSGFHQPDAVDYHRLLGDLDVIPRINSGELDEVWLFAFPYAGYHESVMGGPGAVWCNAPPLAPRWPVSQAERRFVVMGFNYERGVGEMLEDLGHRAESLLSRAFLGARGDANLWERFTRHERTHPGQAECGNVHFAPNSERDYDWGNTRFVQSRCDTWLNFPALAGAPRPVNCAEWGNGDIRQHHLWWFRRFPHVAGSTDGRSNNWWEYVIDPNRIT